MKLLYTNENRLLVNNVLNLVEGAGIEISLKNEFAGGGAGDLVPHETWLEVWVEDEDFKRASLLVESSLAKPTQKGGFAVNAMNIMMLLLTSAGTVTTHPINKKLLASSIC